MATKNKSKNAEMGKMKPAPESAPAPSPSQQQPKAQMGGTPWAVIGLVALLLIAGAWYFTQYKMPTGNGNNSTNSTNDTLTSPAAVALLASFDHLQTLPNSYNLSFAEPIDGIDANISLQQSGKNREATITTEFNTRQYFWIGNQTMACERAGEEPRHCALLGNETQLISYGQRLNATFPSTANAAEQKANHAKMIQLGALHFTSPPQSMTVAGRACTDLHYTFDFTHLTPSQLAQIGMGPSDPLVTVFRDYAVEKCVDNQLGLALVSKLTYNYVDPTSGQKVALGDQLAYQTFQTPLQGPLALPNADVNSSQLLMQVNSVNNLLKAVGSCNSAPNASSRDQCIRAGAVSFGQVSLCRLVSNEQVRGQCVAIVAARLHKPEYCPQAPSAWVNECYAEVAVEAQDSSYCSFIADAGQRQACVQAVQGTSGNATASNATASGAYAPGASPTGGNAPIPPSNTGGNGLNSTNGARAAG